MEVLVTNPDKSKIIESDDLKTITSKIESLQGAVFRQDGKQNELAALAQEISRDLNKMTSSYHQSVNTEIKSLGLTYSRKKISISSKMSCGIMIFQLKSTLINYLLQNRYTSN